MSTTKLDELNKKIGPKQSRMEMTMVAFIDTGGVEIDRFFVSRRRYRSHCAHGHAKKEISTYIDTLSPFFPRTVFALQQWSKTCTTVALMERENTLSSFSRSGFPLAPENICVVGLDSVTVSCIGQTLGSCVDSYYCYPTTISVLGSYSLLSDAHQRKLFPVAGRGVF